VARRARRLVTGAALKEDQEGPMESVRIAHLAREDGDPVAVRLRVIERHRELVLGEDEPARQDGLGHPAIIGVADQPNVVWWAGPGSGLPAA